MQISFNKFKTIIIITLHYKNIYVYNILGVKH